jgi:H+/Cl- antiporter ClcA
MSNPKLAGPNTDGSKSLAKESKAGVSVGAIVFFLLQTLAQGLSGLDTSSWSGWWVPLATAAIGLLAGLTTAYLKRNR